MSPTLFVHHEWLRRRPRRHRKLVTAPGAAQAVYRYRTRPTTLRGFLVLAVGLLMASALMPFPRGGGGAGSSADSLEDYKVLWNGTTGVAINGYTGATEISNAGSSGFTVTWNAVIAILAARTPIGGVVSYSGTPGNTTIPVTATLNSTHHLTIRGPGLGKRGQSGHPDGGTVLQAQAGFTGNNNLGAGNISTVLDLHGDGTGVAPTTNRESVWAEGISIDCNGVSDTGVLMRGSGSANECAFEHAKIVNWRVDAYRLGAQGDSGASAGFHIFALTGSNSQPRATVQISSAIYNNGTGQVAVITSAAHPYAVGDSITIMGVAPVAYCGYFTVVTTTDNTHLTYNLPSGRAFAAGAAATMNSHNVAKGDFAITAISYVNGTGVVTVTAPGHTFANGDWVTIQNINPADYHGTVKIGGVAGNNFTYTLNTGLGLGAGSANWATMQLTSERACLSILVGDAEIGPNCDFTLPANAACAAFIDSGQAPVFIDGNACHWGNGGNKPLLANILIRSTGGSIIKGQYIDNIASAGYGNVVGAGILLQPANGGTSPGQGGGVVRTDLAHNHYNVNANVFAVGFDTVYGGANVMSGVTIEDSEGPGNKGQGAPAIVGISNYTPANLNIWSNFFQATNGIFFLHDGGNPPDQPPFGNSLRITSGVGVSGTDYGAVSITGNSGAITTTETSVVALTMVAGSMIPGTTFRVTAIGTDVSSVANNVTFNLRIGPTTLTGNIAGAIVPVGSLTANGAFWKLDMDVTIRSIGLAGAAIANGQITSLTAGGATQAFAVGITLSATTATVAVDTTVNNLIELTCVTAAATTSINVREATVTHTY